MNSDKVSPVAIAICVVAIVTVFAPAYIFDCLFDGVREQQLQYSDYEMWKFWVECIQNNHAGQPVFSAFPEIVDVLKLIFWLIVSIALPVGGIAATLLWKKRQDALITEKQTSAVFANLKDIAEYQGKDGLILSKNVQTRLNTCFTHFLVIGPTGSGKTQSFFLPNIMKLDPTYSIVITDPKGELYQKTAAHQQSLGREPMLIKLDIKENSRCWNPLDIPKDPVMMAKVCTSVVKNKGGGGGGDQEFWDSTAIDLLMALVYIAKSLPRDVNCSERTYGSFQNIYKILGGTTFDAMIGLSKFAVAELNCRDILARIASFSDKVAPEDTRNSTRFVLKTALAPYAEVAHITATTDIDFRDLKNKPVALYVSVPEHKVTGLAPVISTLFMQIFDTLLEMGEGGRPVFFLLDEFANISKLIGFPQYVATIRSRNLSVAVCLQSGEQLTRNYSEPEKQEIMNNLKINVVLPGLKEEKTL
ncbi:MAG: type IV secretory system conjugative DNA transfer family protein, partial [Deltaproteobacteria bacterium]